ncbi:MAG: hypothetical protein ACK4UN_00165 [Limisphaerales bacterium]
MGDGDEDFLRVVEQVCAKPGMYIGRTDLFLLVMYFNGYIRGLNDAGTLKRDPFAGLLTLLEHEHGFSHPAWPWWRHYLHDKKTDQEAIRALPQFLREAMSVPDCRIDELDRKRPQNYETPNSPHTQKYER